MKQLRYEHERTGKTGKVRHLKKRRSRTPYPMTYDHHGKHMRRMAAWKKNKRVIGPRIKAGEHVTVTVAIVKYGPDNPHPDWSGYPDSMGGVDCHSRFLHLYTKPQ